MRTYLSIRGPRRPPEPMFPDFRVLKVGALQYRYRTLRIYDNKSGFMRFEEPSISATGVNFKL